MTESETMIRLVASWLIVGVPLAWGVTRTVMNALALF